MPADRASAVTESAGLRGASESASERSREPRVMRPPGSDYRPRRVADGHRPPDSGAPRPPAQQEREQERDGSAVHIVARSRDPGSRPPEEGPPQSTRWPRLARRRSRAPSFPCSSLGSQEGTRRSLTASVGAGHGPAAWRTTRARRRAAVAKAPGVAVELGGRSANARGRTRSDPQGVSKHQASWARARGAAAESRLALGPAGHGRRVAARGEQERGGGPMHRARRSLDPSSHHRRKGLRRARGGHG